MMPSLKGDCAKRSDEGEAERSERFLEGRGGILGPELLELSLSEPLDGRGGIAGVACAVDVVMMAVVMGKNLPATC